MLEHEFSQPMPPPLRHQQGLPPPRPLWAGGSGAGYSARSLGTCYGMTAGPAATTNSSSGGGRFKSLPGPGAANVRTEAMVRDLKTHLEEISGEVRRIIVL